MAPPTVPVEVKRRRGTLRADRLPGGGATAATAVARVPVDAPAPDELDEAGKKAWTSALKVCTWIATSDLPALAMMCAAIDERVKLKASIEEYGLMLTISSGYTYVNPAVGAVRKLEEQISKWMQQLGMTPSARGALGVAEVKAASTLDSLAARRRDREAGRRASLPPSPPER